MDEISNSLRELAAAKATVLPELSIVKVDHPPPSIIGNKSLAEAMGTAGVISHLEKAGIDLRFGQEEPLEIRRSTRRALHIQRFPDLVVQVIRLKNKFDTNLI